MPPGSPYSGCWGSDICSPLMVAYTSCIIMQAIPARVIGRYPTPPLSCRAIWLPIAPSLKPRTPRLPLLAPPRLRTISALLQHAKWRQPAISLLFPRSRNHSSRPKAYSSFPFLPLHAPATLSDCCHLPRYRWPCTSGPKQCSPPRRHNQGQLPRFQNPSRHRPCHPRCGFRPLLRHPILPVQQVLFHRPLPLVALSPPSQRGTACHPLAPHCFRHRGPQ